MVKYYKGGDKMIFGSTDSFAVMAEKLSDSGVCGYTTGTIAFFVNGKRYPQNDTVSVMETEISALTGNKSPFVSLANTIIPFSPLTEENIHICAVKTEDKIKISVLHSDVIADTAIITTKDFDTISQRFISFAKQI